MENTEEPDDTEDFIKIEYIEDLVNLSNEVNAGDSKAGKVFKLMRTLDFEDSGSYRNAGDTSFGDLNGDGTVEDVKAELTDRVDGAGFTPIGCSIDLDSPDKAFSGQFDGQKYEIRNLYIKQYIYNKYYLGLFGWVNKGKISNLSVTGNITNTEGTSSGGYIGGIAAYLSNSSINNCNTNIRIINNREYSYYYGRKYCNRWY